MKLLNCLTAFRFGPNTLPNLLRLLALVISPAIALTGLAMLWENQLLGIIAHQQYLVSNYTAVVWLAGGTLLLYAIVGRVYGRWIGWGVFGASLMVLAFSLYIPAWEGYRLSLNYLMTALVLLCSLIVACTHKENSSELFRPTALGIAIAVAGSTVSVAGAAYMLDRTVEQGRQEAQRTSSMVVHDIKATVGDAMRLLDRQRERWQVFGFKPPSALLEREFTTYIRDIKAFKSMALIDNDYRLVVGRPQEGEVLERLEGVAHDPERRQWFEHVRDSGETHVEPIRFLDEKFASAVFLTPLGAPSENHEGFVLTRADFGALIAEGFLNAEPPCCFEVLAGDKTLFRAEPANPGRPSVEVKQDIVLHHDLKVQLRYWKDSGTDTWVGLGLLPEIGLMIGLLFTFFTDGSYRLAYIARGRSVQLQHTAMHDPLTGLPNRRMLEQLLSQAAAQAHAGKTSLSVVFLDVRGVRLVNDSLGHTVGDELLVQVANRLRLSIPEGACIARLEGSEFVVLIEGGSNEDVDTWTEHVIELVCRPYPVNGSALRLHALAGISANPAGQELSDPMVLLQEADVAMLKAKQAGSQPWRRFTPDLGLRLSEQLSLRNDLQDALEHGQLTLNYQPIICGKTGRVSSLEALMRWNHPQFGFISPGQFIPMAEESGLINALTDWALLAACRDSQRMVQEGLAPLPIAVNISTIYFARNDFAEKIRAVLELTGVEPHLLALEITESVVVDDLPAAIEKLYQLRDLGIQTSLDDFGTGYSSLGYLQKLPLAKVKIDRSFIVDVATDPVEATIVKAVAEMATSLGLIVVVEGVETREQFDILKRVGCDQFQGYLFSRPVPYDELGPAVRSAEERAGTG